MDDPYNLQRFIDAQRDELAQVHAELWNDHKLSHWMWFIFPQLKGLGSSQTSQWFGISSRQEAKSYLDHPTLGSELMRCTQLVLSVYGKSAHQIFGTPDDLKFKSSMTLFSLVDPSRELFRDALDRYYGGQLDERTVDLLNRS